MLPKKLPSKNISVSDSVETTDGMVQYKPWFNGLKKFSKVKVLPPKR